MEFKFAYPVRFQRADEGGWVITCRDLPEVVSQAEDDEDRIDVAEGALQAAFETRIMLKESFPPASSKRVDEEIVSVPIETATKAALHMVVREAGESQVAAGRRMKLNEKEVRRLLDPSHSSKVPRIAEAIARYGRRIQISVVDVAQDKLDDINLPVARAERGRGEYLGLASESFRASGAAHSSALKEVGVGRKPQVAVEPRTGGRWAVQTAGTQRADSLHDRKSSAVTRGRELAQHKNAELVIKNDKGRIAQKDSHVRDPRRMKG
jgi:antitoxin HicB